MLQRLICSFREHQWEAIVEAPPLDTNKNCTQFWVCENCGKYRDQKGYLSPDEADRITSTKALGGPKFIFKKAHKPTKERCLQELSRFGNQLAVIYSYDEGFPEGASLRPYQALAREAIKWVEALKETTKTQEELVPSDVPLIEELV